MVFEWVSTKFKQRQLKKAQIQAEADHMVIVSGLSILNPTWRMFFEKYPFYDAKTDSLDFRGLESYISHLIICNTSYHLSECEKCYTKSCWNDLKEDFRDTIYNVDNVDFGYREQTELEHLRELFKILTEKNDYFYGSDFDECKKIIKEYKEQYRNLDETISNFENKIYQKNKEIQRLQTLLDERPVKEVVKVIEKEPKKDNRPITRNSKIYNKFKLHVLKRDEVCQCCGATDKLHVHHLSSYKHDKERRADTSNGIALCEECHHQFHSLYGKDHKNNPVNFAKFMREYAEPMQVNLDYTISDNDVLLEGK